jgi:site-specific recombinase XerD
MAIQGVSLQIIGKSLGHKAPQSTQIYARLHNDPVRQAFANFHNLITELCGDVLDIGSGDV